MHPKMMIALANEVHRDRETERQQLQRSLAVEKRANGHDGSSASRGVARWLLAGISLRPRLS